MSKIGVELSIDVTKIDKARLYQGKKGKYLTMTVFIDPDNKDKYDNNGMITHKKLEGEERAPILGNCKVFWTNSQQNQGAPQNSQGHNTSYTNQPNPANHQPAPQSSGFDDFDEKVPF